MQNRRRISDLIKLLIEMASDQLCVLGASKDGYATRQDLVCHWRLAIPDARISSRLSVVFNDLSSSGTISRLSAQFASLRTVGLKGEDTLTGLSFSGDKGINNLGKCEDDSATSVSLDSGAAVKSVVLGMQPRVLGSNS